jgi:cell division protein FtsB
MPPAAEVTLQQNHRTKRRAGVQPLRRRRPDPPEPSLRWRKALNVLLLFVTVVLVADSLIGDKGLMDTMRARKRSAEMAAAVRRLQEENVALREVVDRLTNDPGAIESIARKELGLIRAGEVLVVLIDSSAETK